MYQRRLGIFEAALVRVPVGRITSSPLLPGDACAFSFGRPARRPPPSARGPGGARAGRTREADPGGECLTRDFQRVRNVRRQALENPRTSMPPSPGNSRSARAVWMTPSTVVGFSPRGVTDVREAEPPARKCLQHVAARIGAVEVQRVDEDAGIRSLDGSQDAHGLGEVGSLGPRRELEVDAESQRRGEVADLSEPFVARSDSGSGSWVMTWRAPSSAAASSSVR